MYTLSHNEQSLGLIYGLCPCNAIILITSQNDVHYFHFFPDIEAMLFISLFNKFQTILRDNIITKFIIIYGSMSNVDDYDRCMNLSNIVINNNPHVIMDEVDYTFGDYLILVNDKSKISYYSLLEEKLINGTYYIKQSNKYLKYNNNNNNNRRFELIENKQQATRFNIKDSKYNNIFTIVKPFKAQNDTNDILGIQSNINNKFYLSNNNNQYLQTQPSSYIKFKSCDTDKNNCNWTLIKVIDNFKSKYIKYKQKYLALKNSL